MEFRKLLIYLSITLVLVIMISFGITYGWYAYENAETSVSGSTIKEIPTIIFSETEYISAKISMPIIDNDRYSYANSNSFSITLNDNLKDYEVGYEISLTGIIIDDVLKNKNYKYELLQDGNIIASGDFSNIGDATSMILMPMTVMYPVSYPTTYNYRLYIWLSDDGSNQNNLMNKNFRSKINITSAVKK